MGRGSGKGGIREGRRVTVGGRRGGGWKERKAVGGGSRRKKINREEELKVVFWNVAGLGNKDEEFWRGLKEWDVICMMETWVGEKGWERVRKSMPKGYVWAAQWAKKGRRGREKEGMVVGVRTGLEMGKEGIEEEGEGVMTVRIKGRGTWWRIVGVYCNGDVEGKMERLEKWTGVAEDNGEKVMIGGDFNARIGREGGGGWEYGGWGERKSKDGKVNAEGRKMLSRLRDWGWIVLNGRSEYGDEEGEFTFTGGRGDTVIDYVLVGEENRDKVSRFEVGERIESDHQPLVVWVEGKEKRKEEKGKGREKLIRVGWTGEVIEEYKKKTRGVDREERRKIGIEGWEGMRDRVKDIKGELMGKERKERARKKGWWDEECEERKREVRRKLRGWRKGKEGRGEYRGSRAGYKELCERKKEEWKNELIREVGKVKTEQEVWGWIGKWRRKKRGVEEGIKKEEWDRYFRELLGGVDERERESGEKRGRGRGDEEGEIGREEFERVVKGIRDKKAIGGDGLEGEVWKYGACELKEEAREVCNGVWRGEGWIEEWMEGWIVPIKKKGLGKRVEDYRGVTVMPALYKIYASVLVGRLEEEVERKGLLEESQVGFRKGRGTVDAIYVLNYVVQRAIGRGKGLYALFIDFKAAFDRVNRRVLWEEMRRIGVRKGLRDRVEEIYKETRGRVKVGEELGERFWMKRGLRQGCPLSPILFNILMAGLEKRLCRRGWGGTRIGGKKVCSITYADDVVVMAEDEGGMREMIAGVEEFAKEMDMVVNVGKTKIMRFRRGGGMVRIVDWWWEGKKLEEVREFKYLGFVFKRNGGLEGQIKDRVGKANRVMREVWGWGKRWFGKDCKRRVWLWDTLVWAVLGYGVEVWGWREWEELERLEERYMRWILGVEWRVPGYMIREELKRVGLGIRSKRRAWGYEEKMRVGKGCEWARRCWDEARSREGEGSKWEMERRRAMTGEGEDWREVERKRENGELKFKEVEKREEDRKERERWEKIRESRYNRYYKWIAVRGWPGYVGKGWEEEKWQRVARFRLGEGMLESRYWEEEEKKLCRVCKGEEESWEHVLERCGREWEGGEEGEKGVVDRVREILDGEGGGEEWLRGLEERRELAGRGKEGRNALETEVTGV